MVPDAFSIEAEADALCATARWCYTRGWVPATSGNFSVRHGQRVLISPSGLDKGLMKPADLLETDLDGQVADPAKKPSAETALHAVIYRHRPGTCAILHVHTIWNTILSGRFAEQGHVSLQGYELLKGLSGVTTHEYEEQIPILENSQDYDALAAELAALLRKFVAAHGVLLSRHGLYTWGKSVAEARRHLEALEFLFEVEGQRLMIAPRDSGAPDGGSSLPRNQYDD
jgi:methylthioribulose-1-phosphate dehydratase